MPILVALSVYLSGYYISAYIIGGSVFVCVRVYVCVWGGGGGGGGGVQK